MRRVINYFDWKANWWGKQGRARTDLQPDIADGIEAYAAKQGYISQLLASSFASKWCKVLLENGFSADWPSHYNSFHLPTDVEDLDEECD